MEGLLDELSATHAIQSQKARCLAGEGAIAIQLVHEYLRAFPELALENLLSFRLGHVFRL